MKSKLQIAKEQNELSRLTLDTAVRDRRTKIVANYDAVDTQTKRRQAQIEFKGEDKIYDQRRRQLGTNIGRDLERNYAPARSIIHQFKTNVVGSLRKFQVQRAGGGQK